MGKVHRSKRMSSNFEMEIKVIKCTFKNADCPPKLLNSVINQFLTPKNNNLFIIPPDLFEKSKTVILIEITYCEENENASKLFIKKIETFINPRYGITFK